MDKQELDSLINENDLVAHYTERCKAMKFIFAKQQIKLSSLKGTNDPYETKQGWLNERESLPTTGWESGVYENDNFNSREFARKHSELQNIIRTQIKILCVTENTDKHYLRNYLRPRMWAQYGGNHKGFCLLFNRRKLCSQIKKRDQFYYDTDAFPVDYDKWHCQFSPTSSVELGHDKVDEYLADAELFFQDLRSMNIMYYLKRKHPDWRDEKEYRWVVFSKSAADDFFVEYGDALEAIVLGCEFFIESFSAQERCEQISRIRELLSETTKIFKLDYISGEYKVHKCM